MNNFIPPQNGGFIISAKSRKPDRILREFDVYDNKEKGFHMKEILENILQDYIADKGNIITILQDVEKAFGFIPEEAVTWFSKKLDVPASRFFGTATFYSQFHLHPRGKNVITVCRGTACHVKGSEKLINRLSIELEMPPDQDTTADLKFTVEKVNCIGACGIAPVAVVNNEVHGKITLDTLMKEIKKLKSGD